MDENDSNDYVNAKAKKRKLAEAAAVANEDTTDETPSMLTRAARKLASSNQVRSIWFNILFIFKIFYFKVVDESLTRKKLKSKCHLCDFNFESGEKRKRCHCKKLVHLDCFNGDGDECQSAP